VRNVGQSFCLSVQTAAINRPAPSAAPKRGLSPDEAEILSHPLYRYTVYFRRFHGSLLSSMLFALRMTAMALYFVPASIVCLFICLMRPFHLDNAAWCGNVYGRPVLWLFGLRVLRELDALDNVEQPYVIVANHLSNYDLFLHGTVVPWRTVSMGMAALRWFPVFGQMYWLAGSVLIVRGNTARAKQSLLKATERIQRYKTSIFVFPEGARNYGKGFKPFRKGAFQMAISAGVPIVPICASTYKRTMRLNRWRAGHIIVRALSPIATQGLTLDDMPVLMERCHAQMKQCIDELDARVAELDHSS
jgi:1-acyl-sn-glycerol-3-phosphate acyltransferase